MKKIKIPETVLIATKKIETAGFEVFAVGGCVRDFLLNREPQDWDLTTNARPEELLKIFPDGKYENNFGTVLVAKKYLLDKNEENVVINKNSEKKEKIDGDFENKGSRNEKIVEITTYRLESNYKDKRHPEKIKFSNTLKDDLMRRDFMVNAMAMRVSGEDREEIIDLFGGQEDLKNKIIKTVGDAEERFNEDALRLMRAVRFATQLNFKIEEKTFLAVKKLAPNLKFISKERIRDEFIKIILSENPARGIELLMETNLMKNVIPELYETVDVRQNRHHYHGPYNTVFKHLLASLENCPSQKMEVRLATFLHDIGKPKSKRGEGEFSTFHRHEYIGARMVERILERLKFSRAVVKKTVLLVKNHMFYYNVDEVGEKGVRKVVRKVGLENINDLIDVRIGDRLGSGVAKAVPYKLRHFQYMVEKVSDDPISVGQLKIDGNILIRDLKIKPGPKIGAILDALLAEVLDNPELNNGEVLLKKAEELSQKDLKELLQGKKKAKQKISQEQEREDENKKQRHWVK